MAKLYNNKVSLAFDIYGCPQRCKHCWIGDPCTSKMDSQKVISKFIEIQKEQEREKYYDLEVEFIGPYIREPHFGNNYIELYEKTDRINGCVLEVKKNFELISLWRLTRDKGYIKWLKNRGFKRAQMKVFGLKETNNFFCGREGAHKDLVEGTEILLDNEIIPRWQVYYNKKGINELDGVLKLTEELNIWRRVKELGEDFNIHGFTFQPEGRGFENHDYRIEKGDEKMIPNLLWEKSKDHFGEDYQLYAEDELTKEILDDGDFTSEPKEHWLWFYVTADWDVYPNFTEIAPWWRLGNLKIDNWKTILVNYIKNKPLGLKVMTKKPVRDLAKKYGNLNGNKLYMSKNELIFYWIGKHCRNSFKY